MPLFFGKKEEVDFEEFNALEVERNSVSLLWFNRYSGIVLKTPSKTVVVDPTELSGEKAATLEPDLMVVSHEHYDHFDRKVLKIVQAGKAVVIAPEHVIEALKGEISGENLKSIKAGGEIEVGGVRINAEKAVHPSREPLSFAITSEDGIVIYHAIDSQTFEGMREIGERHRPDIAIVPIGIAPGTSPENGAKAVGLIKPKVAIPYHSDKGFEEFQRKVREKLPETEVAILKRGEIYTYRK
ncbi:MAG: MBL fold metallo-hydrolase [Candidatus Hydrothermarchaeales archaeon]